MVEKKSVINTPKKKPRYTIFFATAFPYLLFDKSVIKKAIGYVNAPYVNIFSKLKYNYDPIGILGGIYISLGGRCTNGEN